MSRLNLISHIEHIRLKKNVTLNQLIVPLISCQKLFKFTNKLKYNLIKEKQIYVNLIILF